MDSGWYSALLFVPLLLPGCLKQNKFVQNDLLPERMLKDEMTAGYPPDVEGSYVQMVTHLEDDTGAVVAVGDDDK